MKKGFTIGQFVHCDQGYGQIVDKQIDIYLVHFSTTINPKAKDTWYSVRQLEKENT